MKNYVPVSLLGLLLIGVSGCTNYSFVPQTTNVPLFTAKEQIRINTTFNTHSIDFQAAVSPIHHFGIIANGMIRSRRAMQELGLGYFYPVTEKFVVEIYGGFAKGHYSFVGLNQSKDGIFGITGFYNRTYNIQANRFFIQPDIGIHIKDKIDLGISLKTCYWDFPVYFKDVEYWSRLDGGGYYYNRTQKDSVNLKHGSQITFEPAITFRVGGKYVKFMAQTGVYLYADQTKGSPLPYENFPLFVRLGVTGFIDFKNFRE